ncbi:GerMN domain-containing protein [Caldalkalibacillus salinus]|uniref:GerMN domain-containing protein n=1 Tax=Caldalkalibacillus salinus TaxID=2803787 RepID=UPI0019241DC9|nr:GerMN domain-containing protein [Caldalkalibacillus salinus]
MKQMFTKGMLSVLALLLVLGLAACGQDQAEGPEDSNGQGSAEEEQSQDSGDAGDSETNNDEGHEDNHRDEEESQMISETLTVYYTDMELLSMTQEEREIAYEQDGQPWFAIWRTLQSPQNDEHVSLWENVELLNASLEDGILSLDLGQLDDVNIGSTGEAYAIQAVLHSYGQIQGVEFIAFTVEGEVRETLFGHVSTSEPLPVDEQLIQ